MKSKLLLLLGIFATLNFSCSDDNDNKIALTAGELSQSEGRFGDEITITGEGFSQITEENIVTINDLTIPVKEATSTQLIITIPKEATTGKLSVRVDESNIDFGIFTVRKEKLFVLKSIFDNGGDYIITIDPETGKEELFMELPKIEHDIDLMYSSLCYLNKTKELVIMTRAEWPVKDYSVLKINIETKTILKKEFSETLNLEDINLISDGESNLFLIKNFQWTETDHNKSSIYRFNTETGEQELLTDVTEDYIFGTKILKETNELIIITDNDEWEDRSTKLISVDLNTEKQKLVPINYPKSLYGFIIGPDNSIYLANETVFEQQVDLLKINTLTGSEEVVMEFPDPKLWYGRPTFYKTNNEMIYFIEDDNDVTSGMLKINLTDKTTEEVKIQNAQECYYGNAFSIFI